MSAETEGAEALGAAPTETVKEEPKSFDEIVKAGREKGVENARKFSDAMNRIGQWLSKSTEGARGAADVTLAVLLSPHKREIVGRSLFIINRERKAYEGRSAARKEIRQTESEVAGLDAEQEKSDATLAGVKSQIEQLQALERQIEGERRTREESKAAKIARLAELRPLAEKKKAAAAKLRLV